MSDLTAAQHQSLEPGAAPSPFGTTPQDSATASYYRPAQLGTTSSAGRLNPDAGDASATPASSGHYDPAIHQGASQRYFGEGGGDVGATKLGQFQAGVAAKDGSAYASGGFGKLRLGGIKAGGHADYDPKTGQVHAAGGGRGGGFNLDNARASYGVKGPGSVDASVGNVTSDTVVQGAKFDGGLRQGQASLDHLEGMGDLLRIRQEASFGQIGHTNSLDGAAVNYDFNNLRDPRLGASFKELSYGGLSGKDLKHNATGPGNSSVDAKLGGFGLSALDVKDAKLDLSKRGLSTSVGNTWSTTSPAPCPYWPLT